MDEGYIKFHPHWQKAPAFPEHEVRELITYRQKLYARKLIGAYPDGIGYGNISKRWKATDQFLISGSATGNLEVLGPEHFSLVTEVDLAANTLRCRGPVIASSESMSHAVIYRECPEVRAVIHVHHPGMWNNLLHQVPTTSAEATYGSPEMASAISELLAKTDLRQTRLFVMAGHEEGIFSFGNDLEQAYAVIIAALAGS